MAPPRTIDEPIPDKWREPIASFLRELSVKDAPLLLSETRFGGMSGSRKPNSIVIRIEDKQVCNDDVCLTVIGHLEGQRFVQEASFIAGPKTVRQDVGMWILGILVVPDVFLARKSKIMLLDMPEGWIVLPLTD